MGSLLLLLGISGYQAYVGFFPVLMIFAFLYGYINNDPNRYSLLRIQGLVFFIALLGYAVIVYTSVEFLELSQARAFDRPDSPHEFLSEKIHGVVNLIVNLFIPVLTYHFDISTAFQKWEWIPFTFIGLAFIAVYAEQRRWSVACISAICIPIFLITPALVVFLSGQSPESWRVSIPSWFGFCLGLAMILDRIGRFLETTKNTSSWWILGCLCAAIYAALFPVTRYESSLRVIAQQWDDTIIAEIRKFWDDRNDKDNPPRIYSIVHQNRVRSTIPSKLTTRLTVSYRYHGPISAFDYDWSWEGFVSISGFNPANNSEINKSLISLCRRSPDFEDKVSGMKIAHDQGRRLSLVCS
jgi:hypothetical protein